MRCANMQGMFRILQPPSLVSLKGLTEEWKRAGIAKEGAEVAKAARKEVEKRLGRSVVSPEKAIDHIQSPEELPFSKPDEQ